MIKKKKNMVLDILTSTPEPKIPPKYQTSSEILSLTSIVPPGKNKRILARTHSIVKGMRVTPTHLAHPPQHIFQNCTANSTKKR